MLASFCESRNHALRLPTAERRHIFVGGKARVEMGFLALILAAGEGKRMKSDKSKVVFEVCGKPMVVRVIDEAVKAGAKDVCVVVGHKKENVIEAVGDKAGFVTQEEQLGTGHAVMQAEDYIKKSGDVLILAGDTPLITDETLKGAYEAHIKGGNSCTVITADVINPHGYGRIIRDSDGSVKKIVEQKDASEDEKKVTEINSGMYFFKSSALLDALKKITNNNAQGEYYLTDTLSVMKEAGLKVGAFTAENPLEISGVNDRVQLAEADKFLRKRINSKFALSGVTIIDIENTYISDDAQIGRDSIVYPGTIISGASKIGLNVTIGPNCRIVESSIGDNTDVYFSTIIESRVGNGTHVGPYAYMRPGSGVGDGCKVGDFVEIKNSSLGNGTKVSHLTYIGDADVGERVNFGCGTVIVNYDGKKKYRTTIGNDAFIGCNSNLVSPVNVEDNAYVAAGSTITDDVPESSLAIARSRQVIKTEWTDKRKK